MDEFSKYGEVKDVFLKPNCEPGRHRAYAVRGKIGSNDGASCRQLGGGFTNFLMFTPKIGEDEPILTNIFQRG